MCEWFCTYQTSDSGRYNILAMRSISATRVNVQNHFLNTVSRIPVLNTCFLPHFRCMARVRTKTDGGMEIVETQHNHGILTERRKKGSLKAMYDEKRKLKEERNG